jgi:hypothetical protein
MVLNSGVVVLLGVVFGDAEVVRGLLLVGLLPRLAGLDLNRLSSAGGNRHGPRTRQLRLYGRSNVPRD